MKKNLQVFLGVLLCSILFLPLGVNALEPTEVGNYVDLKAALGRGESVKLTDDIEVEEPIVLSQTLTIDGDGHALKAIYEGGSGNKSILFTNNGTLTLQNLSLLNSPKYGVQAYQGGNVVLDGVTISNNTDKFGAVLINGGTVTIKSLTMTNNLYGIEFATGVDVTGNSVLVMDGEIKGDQKDPLYIDVNQVKKLKVTNTESSKQKINLKDNVLVLTEGDKVIANSNVLPTGTAVEVDGVKDEAKEPETTPETPETPETDKKDEVENPKTADGIMFMFAGLIISASLVIVAKKKLA